MSLKDDLAKLDQDGQKAYELIEAGKLGAAQKIINRLKRSWAVSDAFRIAVPLEGLIQFRKRKKQRAIELLQNNICYLWGDYFALELMRACKGKIPTERTSLYRMRIKGGEPVLGVFTYFGPEYITTIEVFADDEFEAFEFLDALLRYANPDERRLLEFTRIEFAEDYEPDFKGIYACQPFTTEEDDGFDSLDQ